jgi:hypothetical protein
MATGTASTVGEAMHKGADCIGVGRLGGDRLDQRSTSSGARL